MKKKYKRFQVVTVGLAALTLSLGLVGCGQNGENIVRDVSVRTYVQNNDVYVEVLTVIDTGNAHLPSIQLPIFDPRNPGKVYGSVAIREVFAGGGGAEIGIAANLTTITGVQGLNDPTLPNGTPIPVGGLGNTPVIKLSISQDSKIYAAYNPGVALIGAALSLKEFDQIGQRIGGVNFFPSFSFPNGIRGIAGIYTGQNSHQNGLALFVDIGPALKPPGGGAGLTLRMSEIGIGGSQLLFPSKYPSSRQRRAINRRLYELDQAGATLHLQ